MDDTRITEVPHEVVASARALVMLVRAYKLYPETGPFRASALEAAALALGSYFASAHTLTFGVGRSGLVYRGTEIHGVTGMDEIAEALRIRGVAEITLTAGVAPGDLRALLAVLQRDAADLGRHGGVASVLVADGVHSVRTADVDLAPVDPTLLSPDAGQSYEEFLRALASDDVRMGAWLATAARIDPDVLERTLGDLVVLLGPGDLEGVSARMARAFCAQSAVVRDAVTELALNDSSPARPLFAGMFERADARMVASGLVRGEAGRNPMRLSYVLAALPLGASQRAVAKAVSRELLAEGSPVPAVEFVLRMVVARVTGSVCETRCHPPAGDEVAGEDLAALAAEFVAAQAQASRRVMDIYAELLWTETDASVYRQTLTSFAALIESSLVRGEIAVAADALGVLAAAQNNVSRPWPELAVWVTEAIDEAISDEAAAAMLGHVIDDESIAPHARRVMSSSSTSRYAALTAAAIERGGLGLRAAERVVGDRLLDFVRPTTQTVCGAHVGPVVAWLARSGDPASLGAIERVMSSKDAPKRREVVSALAAAAVPVAIPVLSRALRDTVPEVALAAVRGLGEIGAPGSTALVERLREVEHSASHAHLSAEIIKTLARIGDGWAHEEPERLIGVRARTSWSRNDTSAGLASQALGMRGAA